MLRFRVTRAFKTKGDVKQVYLDLEVHEVEDEFDILADKTLILKQTGIKMRDKGDGTAFIFFPSPPYDKDNPKKTYSYDRWYGKYREEIDSILTKAYDNA
jgi:hypothetical protein